MHATPEQSNDPIHSIHAPATTLPPRSRLGTAGGFTAGIALAGLVSFLSYQSGATSSTHANPTPQDPRVDHLLSLLEAERNCDTGCLRDLRMKADKTAALEQTLGELQETATDAEQRAGQLETDKDALAEQLNQQAREFQASQAAWERKLADAEARLPTGKLRTHPNPALSKVSSAAQTASAATSTPPPWRILGMTESTVVVSTGDRVVALAAGELLNGYTVNRIDLNSGVADTSGGTLYFKK